MPLKLDAKLPRKAAIASGNVDSDRGAANAYIVFQTLEAATAALEHNMKEFEGHHLRVDKAALNKKAVKVAQKESGSAAAKAAAAVGKGVVYDPARSVFIGNLHLEAEVRQL